MQLFRDPLWQFVEALVAIVALILSIIVTLFQRQKKRLEYEVSTNLPLLTVELHGRLKVLLDGRPVDDPSLVVIRFTNRGNVPIRASDYERPLSVTFGKHARVISADITGQQPTNLGASAVIDPPMVTVPPLLLNPGDYFELQCLLSTADNITPAGRIVGVSELRQFIPAASPSPFVFLLGLFFIVTGIGALVYVAPLRSCPPPTFWEVLYLGVATVGALLMSTAGASHTANVLLLLRYRKDRRRLRAASSENTSHPTA